MLFMNNTKKKKHPIVAVMAGAFAVYGAYSMVAMAKRCVCDKMSCVMAKMKKTKCQSEGMHGEGEGEECRMHNAEC